MNKRALTEKQFIKKHKIEDAYEKAKLVDADLWENIVDIRNHYEEHSKYCKKIVEGTVLEFLNTEKGKVIHSARYRVKEIDSLLVKIIKKKAQLSVHVKNDYELEKYRELNGKNYFMILTDISGIRILIRYREEWKQVHNLIWEKYYQGDEYYLKDCLEDYKTNTGKPFIAERPKVYYRNPQDRYLYEQIGRDIFELTESDKGYNSIHYIINIDGKYTEVQVRTIWDEAWSECTHDIVYKEKKNIHSEELENLSQCLAQQTMAAESLSNLLYQRVNKKAKPRKTLVDEKKNINIEQCKKENSVVQERMKILENIREEKFNGNIDSIM